MLGLLSCSTTSFVIYLIYLLLVFYNNTSLQTKGDTHNLINLTRKDLPTKLLLIIGLFFILTGIGSTSGDNLSESTLVLIGLTSLILSNLYPSVLTQLLFWVMAIISYYILITKDLLITLTFFEIYFYTSTYILIYNYRLVGKYIGSDNLVTLLVPLFFFNFVSSWFFLIGSLWVTYTINSTYYIHLKVLPITSTLLLGVGVILKLNLGPWFFKLSSIYRLIPITYFYFYVTIYFIFLAPHLLILISLTPWPITWLMLIFLLNLIFIVPSVFNVFNLREIILYSSFANYIYILFLFCLS